MHGVFFVDIVRLKHVAHCIISTKATVSYNLIDLLWLTFNLIILFRNSGIFYILHDFLHNNYLFQSNTLRPLI